MMLSCTRLTHFNFVINLLISFSLSIYNPPLQKIFQDFSLVVYQYNCGLIITWKNINNCLNLMNNKHIIYNILSQLINK